MTKLVPKLLRDVMVLCCVARPLTAQDPRLVERFSPDVVARLSPVIDSTAREGLPTDPLVLRALEGSAKGATPDKILAVLSRLRAALRIARASLGPEAATAELTTAAGAIEAGVPAAQLVELRRLRAGQTLTAPLGAYLDLIARGAAPDRAWDRIADLAKHRAADAEYRKLSPVDLAPQPGTTGPPDKNLSDAGWTLFTGGGAAQLDNMPAGTISSLGASMTQPLGAVRLHFDGTTANHPGIGITGTMAGDLRYGILRGPWQIEMGPMLASGRDIGTAWSRAGGVLAQATRTSGAWSVFGSVRGGIAWNGSGRSLWAGHAAGAAVRIGNFHFSAAWQGTTAAETVQSTTVVADTITDPPASLRNPGGPPVRYARDTSYQQRYRGQDDLSLATSWAKSIVSVHVEVGRRMGGVAPQEETWWSLGTTLRLTQTVGLTLSSSMTTPDLLLGLRGERSTMMGLQLSTPRRVPRIPPDAAVPAGIEIVRVSPREVHLVFTLPGTRESAAIASDATNWQAEALTRTLDGRWDIILVARPGLYRVNLRCDDGPWQVPPGLRATDDGFGGRVGLLVVQ